MAQRIYNLYEVEVIIKKKELVKKEVVFSFAGIKDNKATSFTVVCNHSDNKYTVEFILGLEIKKYSSKKIGDFISLIKSNMISRGFKSATNPIQLALDLNNNSNQLSLDDINPKASKEELLKLITLRLYKGEKKADFEKELDRFLENPYLYRDVIALYVKDHLGYKVKVQLEEIEIREKDVYIDGIFRNKEIGNWEEYVADNYPHDIPEMLLKPLDVLKMLQEIIV